MMPDHLNTQNRTYHEPQRSMALLPNYYKWTYGTLKEHIFGDVVELGCGAGLGIPHYIENAQTIFAVDHDKELLRRVSLTYPTRRVVTIKADLLGDWNALAHLRADVVIMMDVLEHFRDDATFLKNATSLLKPNARLILKVPAQRSLYSNIDRASGHYRRYDFIDIQRLAGDSGLYIHTMRHLNRIGALAYRIMRNKKANFSRVFTANQLYVINSLIPLIRLADTLCVSPGLSIICVLFRNGTQGGATTDAGALDSSL
jgi:2-polyprenyl-3-methyl-5-hydroxy-6-metoxy-1,4-benzoquinol methylase